MSTLSDPARKRVAGLGLAAWLACCGALAAPSTFGPVIGPAVLCLDQLDNDYFYAYLSATFGPSYKHEGGAYWFKAEGSLWGTAISDVMVSDDSGPLVFLGAVAEATPDKLDEAIRAAAGTGHTRVDGSAFPVRQSALGSKIVYFNTRSKIYCARFKSPRP